MKNLEEAKELLKIIGNVLCKNNEHLREEWERLTFEQKKQFLQDGYDKYLYREKNQHMN